MAGKTLALDAPPELLNALCAALRLYADAAWPPGGSECSQAARETLLNAVQGIEASIAAGTTATISRRLRATVRAACDYYGETQSAGGQRFTARAALFTLLLDGQPVALPDYQDALDKDSTTAR